MPAKPTVAGNVLTALQALNARGAAGIATAGNLAHGNLAGNLYGVKPGRLVYDPVSGQMVQVIGAATAYLAPGQVPEG
ncbi:MAG: hypothetical protein ACRD4R_13045 [Candidatus Acidiferrales bacterium]